MYSTIHKQRCSEPVCEIHYLYPWHPLSLPFPRPAENECCVGEPDAANLAIAFAMKEGLLTPSRAPNRICLSSQSTQTIHIHRRFSRYLSAPLRMIAALETTTSAPVRRHLGTNPYAKDLRFKLQLLRGNRRSASAWTCPWLRVSPCADM